jgi:Mrp family chromosome partitioning ATPase
MPTQDELLQALTSVMDPELHRSIVDLQMVEDLRVDECGEVAFTLALTAPTCPLRERIGRDATTALLTVPGVSNVTIRFGEMSPEKKRAVLGGASSPGLPKLGGFNRIGRVIAVMSGKGGVGKSSVTALLACALARQGKKVGILDADVTGPSIPKLFNLPPGGLRGSEMGMLPAAAALGIRVVSTNLMVPTEDAAVLWKGPVIAATIRQFYEQVLWGRLDVLLVDLPPGTGDAPLAVIQNLPLDGVLLVTSPQGLASLVVRKAVRMLEHLNVPILGVVENLTAFLAPDGTRYEIFGPSHAHEVAELAGVDVLARLPITPELAALSDAGRVHEVLLPEVEALAGKIEEITRKDAKNAKNTT